ncbi:MAG: hypothetical protein ACJ71J_04015 [Nitrososphaeraceae archaeon]
MQCTWMAPNLTADARSATVTRSFRFDAEMSKILDEEAERMGVSVNALVGIILKRYSEFTRYLSKIDMIVLNRELLISLLEAKDEEYLYKLGAKLGGTVSVDTIMFWKKDVTEESVLEYIEKIICLYGHLGTYDEVSQPDSKTIVIRHRLGRKGSKFFEGYLRSTLKNTVGKDAMFEVTDSSIKFEIRSSFNSTE